jgi:hypothetical protein
MRRGDRVFMMVLETICSESTDSRMGDCRSIYKTNLIMADQTGLD